ncbi:MAG: tRNA lysidine(34) synthetase TilS [Bacillota bacterium]|nr:tRNA lysidine(34) synthetase TilS [Bacillota bacterium]
MNTENTVLQFIRENNLINSGDTVICGLSGGADSCSMVHLLFSLREKLGFDLVCAHLNHMLRDSEATRDEEFSKEYCSFLGIPFYSKKADVYTFAKGNGLSVEDAGRQIRYAFFDEIAEATGANKIATAHNRGDNAETVFMHIIRGCGIKGLCGIDPMRGRIIRPLLLLSRKDIEQYCADNRINYITDSTNLHTDYTRNKVRLSIFPQLQELNPSVEQSLCRLAENARRSCAYTDKIIENIHLYKDINSCFAPLNEIIEIDISFYGALIGKMLKTAELSCEPSQKNLDAVYSLVHSDKTTGSIDLGGNIIARLSYDKFVIIDKGNPSEFEYKLTESETININGLKIFISNLPFEKAEACIPLFEDYNDLTVRSRKTGDKIKINGMTRKLQDVFVNMKIDRMLRDRLVIITQGGQIVWTQRVGTDDKIKTMQGFPKKYIIIEKLGE